MKYKLLLFVFVFFIMGRSIAQVKEAVLQASGLTCALCAKSIFINLSSLAFVDNVDTDLNASSFLIRFKPDSHVDPQQLRKKVEDAGFFISNLQLKISIINKKIGADNFLLENGTYYHILNGKSENFSGSLTVEVVEKEYLTAKVFKKISAAFTQTCYKSSYVKDCKIPSDDSPSMSIFHVRLVK